MLVTLFIVVLVVLVIVFVAKYNRLQGFAHQVRRCNGDILATLQKRADLANRLMDIAKEYGAHEKFSHITVSNNYREAVQETNEALVRINALSHNFPQLKASDSYNLLMGQLSDIETGIQKARELYNLAASNYNAYRSQLPQALFASTVGFQEAPYFDTSNMEAIKEFRTDDGEMLKKAFSNAMDKTVETVKKGAEEINSALNKKQEGTRQETNAPHSEENDA